MEQISLNEKQKENLIKNIKKNNKNSKIAMLIIAIISCLILIPIALAITIFIFIKIQSPIMVILSIGFFMIIFFFIIIFGIGVLFTNDKKVNKIKNNEYVAYIATCVNKYKSYNQKHRSYLIYYQNGDKIRSFRKTPEDYKRINIGDKFIIIYYKNINTPSSYLLYEFEE